MSNAITVGDDYDVDHQRKGKAVVKVLEYDDTWIVCHVVSGSFKGVGAGSYRGPGDEITIRDTLATFTPIETRHERSGR